MPRLPVVNVKGLQHGFCEGDPKEAGVPRSSDRESRNIPGPVKSAPGGAPVREVPQVEEAPKRAQAPAPVPASMMDASLGGRGDSLSREPYKWTRVLNTWFLTTIRFFGNNYSP